MSLLNITNLQVQYDGTPILKHINASVDTSQRWAIIGKNGAGKSTLIKSIAGILHFVEGLITVGNKNVQKIEAKERARLIAYVPQKPEAIAPFTVADFIMMGRYSRMGNWGIPDSNDEQAVQMAMEACDLINLHNRMLPSLSGGEMQRALLAGAIAQETPVLLLDEPTTYLDPAHERLFFKSLDIAYKNRNLTSIMVTHDINTALISCTHILALLEGTVFFAGTIESFRSKCPKILEDIFGLPFDEYCDSKKQTVFGTWGQQL